MVSRRKFILIAGSAAAATFLNVKMPVSAKETVSAEDSKKATIKWGMVIDVEKCTECMKELIEKTGNEHVKPPCVVACDTENNVPDFKDKRIDPQWIRIFEVEKEGVKGIKFYLPVLCNQCDYPACVQVCPTKASFKRYDGIVMIDYHRCIGCRYCMIACPYGARSFNWVDPRKGFKNGIPPNPKVPIRREGVVEKCHFCYYRIDRGEEPACVVACREKGKNAMVFGNLLDPNSEISKILAKEYVVVLRPSLGTKPNVYYYDFP